ncbi:serine hydrolase [Pyxidicoccus parkwayensis]|uniref:Serine hydrolase n=1 Tax=Pyxidicoccus parkwayensis TaxID=2813578 RepID=A0ABX7NUH8_9BACT|nr:serine hydrolase [Pyxidicoccus parkwaysis]QSQ22138.1 serine hydrolase [Pyxidicoccus parkwaysis]
MRGGIGSRWLSLLVTLLGTLAGAAPSPWRAVLSEDVEAAARDFDGALALYVRDVSTGEEYAHDASTPMYLSSAIKVAVMVEVLRQVDAGMLTLDTPLIFEPEDIRDGMHPMANVPPGTPLTVATLLEYMMVHSDNAAADLLIKQVGIDNVNAGLERRGVHFGPLVSLLEDRHHVYAKLDPKGAELTPQQVHELGRKSTPATRARALSEVLGHTPAWTGGELESAFDAWYAEGTNSAPMREMGRLLEQLARCEGLSSASCERAKTLMRSCHTGQARIRAGLPGTARWAHKTGTQHRRACDVGILELQPGRPIIVAACTRGFRRVAEAELLLARIGRALTRAFTNTPVTTGGYSAPP